METFEIRAVRTHASAEEDGRIAQWAEVTLIIPKDFNWEKPDALLKKLKAATDLIGAPEK